MTTLGLDFLSPWLLLGLAAAAIPVVLHLLSSRHAQEVAFPTLRFLRISMEKTARRRRLEHWLLMLLRCLVLGFLALSVAEPVVKAAGGFWSGRHYAAVLVLDNSYSMNVRSAGGTRFERARREAAKLLGGSEAPAQAELSLTNGVSEAPALHGDLSELRDRLDRARLASGQADIGQRVAQAAELLKKATASRKLIYVFSDMQRTSFADLRQLKELKEAGIPLMVVDCSDKPLSNVGVADLQVIGRKVVNQPLEIAATLINSSPADKMVEAWLQVDGRPMGEPVRKVLNKAGTDPSTTDSGSPRAQSRGDGDRAVVRFRHRFTTPGTHVGQVVIDQADDLDTDNVRRFCIELADRVEALLVRGGGRRGGLLGGMDPAAALQTALDPYAGTQAPWSVKVRTVPAGRFAPSDLAKARVAFFAEVASFSPQQAAAIEKFVRAGGTAVFFMGPDADVANYNQLFAQHNGLLPGRLDQAVGNVGPTAPAINAVKNLSHPYLAGLYETPADYPKVLVQRYYRLTDKPTGWDIVFSTPQGDPMVASRSVGAGRVALFATTAGPEWNTLASTPLLLPIVTRICLEAGEAAGGGDETYLVGAPVTIRPKFAGAAGAVNVTPPRGKPEVLPLVTGPAGLAATFTHTDQIGTYRWSLAGAAPNAAGAGGEFVTNPDGAESDLARIDPQALAEAVKPADMYYGKGVDEVYVAAVALAAGDNLWDRLIALVILLLVVEAVVANRPGKDVLEIKPLASAKG